MMKILKILGNTSIMLSLLVGTSLVATEQTEYEIEDYEIEDDGGTDRNFSQIEEGSTRGMGGQMMRGMGGQMMRGMGGQMMRGMGGHAMRGMGGHAMRGMGGHAMRGMGGHAMRGMGGHAMRGMGGHAMRGMGGHAMRGMGGHAMRGMGGYAMRGMGGYAMRGMGGHAMRGMGGHAMRGMGGHAMRGMGGHAMRGIGGHPMRGMGGHPMRGDFNIPRGFALELDANQLFSARFLNRIATLTTPEEQLQAQRESPAVLATLAPDEAGLTMTSQPTLYWYMSKWNGELQFTLNQVGEALPVLELVLNPAPNHIYETGLYRLRLEDYNIHLKANQNYEWFVTVVRDPDQRSSDFMASGLIRYQSKTPTGQKPQKTYTNKNLFWYDAVTEICGQLEKNPSSQEQRQALAQLLEQEKMPKLAYYFYYY
jgi:hypothetical protein